MVEKLEMTDDCTPKAEIKITPKLVRSLIESQVPDVAELTGESDPQITFVSAGWDNEIYRLGNRLAVRMPRRQLGADLIVNEQQWLPRISYQLTVPVPTPLFIGNPANGYPWTWSIVPWFEGQSWAESDSVDTGQLANDLAVFLNRLHIESPPDAPLRTTRGVPLAARDQITRDYISKLSSSEQPEFLASWNASLAAAPWDGPKLWLHGDLHPLNVLIHEKQLTAVIDFGDVTAGDPAVDIAIAWMGFDETDRRSFRAKLCLRGQPVDEATWLRARGWALSIASAVVVRTKDDPILNRIGRSTLERVLQASI